MGKDSDVGAGHRCGSALCLGQTAVTFRAQSVWEELGGTARLGRAYHLVRLSEPEAETRSLGTEYG